VSDRVPPLLTVEEAAKHLRIGRTKAYALAQEWRTTGGKSGLPVVDFGHVLRVPRHQLELLIGGPLDAANQAPVRAERANDASPAAVSDDASAEPNTAATVAPRQASYTRHRRNTRPRDNQLDLFNHSNS
jgi:hypothetical protein